MVGRYRLKYYFIIAVVILLIISNGVFIIKTYQYGEKLNNANMTVFTFQSMQKVHWNDL